MIARRARALAPTVALVAAACARDPMNMAEQPKYLSYAPNPYYDDGHAMRPPEPGTVAQERPVGSEAFLTGREAGRFVTAFPLPLTRDLLARGRHQFEISCAACHGLVGDARTVVASKMAQRPPPSLLEGEDAPPGELFTVLSEGYGVMPSYAPQLPVRDRWGVVAYLLALRHSQRVPAATLPAEVRRTLERSP